MTDASLSAHPDVPNPEAHDRTLSPLHDRRSGHHQRTRSTDVRLIEPNQGRQPLPQHEVVPGGETTAWVRVTSSRSGEPIGGAPVVVSLSEGGMARSTFRLTTDVAGTAMVRVPIPKIDESAFSFDLTARSVGKQHASNT